MNPLPPSTRTGLALTLGLTAAAAQSLASDIPQSAKPLNVVLIISDQMSARALPIYGNNTGLFATPNMARLAREGATFDNSICTAPYCSPTRSSLVTVYYPVSTGITTNVQLNKGNGALSLDKIITENILFNKGYVTGHYGKWHLGPLNDWPCYADKANARDIYDRTYFKSFAAIRAANHPTALPPKPGEVLASAAAEDGYGFYQTQYITDKLKDAPQQMQKSIGSFGRLGTPPDLYNWTQVTKNGADFIKTHANKDAPFMVTISIGPPHPEYCIPDLWYSRVDPAKIQFNPSSFTHPQRYLQNGEYKIGQYIGEEGSREKMRCYYAMVAFVDDMIGRILKTIDDAGIADNTLVVFISDHGDPIGTQGFLYGKSVDDFLEEALRVPTLMRLPGQIPAGKKITASFSSVDLAPTIRDYLGVNTYPTQGRSFRPLLEGAEKDDKGVGFAVSQRQLARCIRGEIDGKIYIYSKMLRLPPPPEKTAASAAATTTAVPAVGGTTSVSSATSAAAKAKLSAKSNVKDSAKAEARIQARLEARGAGAKSVPPKAAPAPKAAPKAGAPKTSSYEELFNLTDDPCQMKNVIDDPAYAAIKTRLITEYDKYADLTGDRHIEDLPAKGLATWGNFRNIAPEREVKVSKNAKGPKVTRAKAQPENAADDDEE